MCCERVGVVGAEHLHLVGQQLLEQSHRPLPIPGFSGPRFGAACSASGPLLEDPPLPIEDGEGGLDDGTDSEGHQHGSEPDGAA